MPSFDVSSELDWQSLDDAVNIANKEVLTRYDFKGVKTELTLDKKLKTLTFWISEPTKLQAFREIFDSKAIKRGLSPLAFDPGKVETAHGGSSRQVMKVMAGIEKEKAKEVVALIKDSKLKVQASIQDEKVRVTGKNRDDLQETIALLRNNIEKLKLPMQFGNFRE